MKCLVACLVALLAGAAQAAESPSCPVTPRGEVGTAALKTHPPGEIVFKPGGAGFVQSDGSLAMKHMWHHQVPGRVRITGRRLDGEAGPLRASIADGFDDKEIQPTLLIYPTPGCWEVVGQLGRHRVSFVAHVILIGPGPTRADREPGLNSS